MNFKFEVEGGDFTNAGTASSQVKKMMKQLGVDAAIIKRTVVALYEAEVNIVAHAYRVIFLLILTNPESTLNWWMKVPEFGYRPGDDKRILYSLTESERNGVRCRYGAA